MSGYTKVTASVAKQEYRLTEEDLAKMKCDYRRNPHARFGPPMRLFSAKQVVKLGAIRLREYEEGKAAIAAARKAKEDEKEQRRKDRLAKKAVREAEKQLVAAQRELKKAERERIKLEKANAPPKPRATKKQKLAVEETTTDGEETTAPMEVQKRDAPAQEEQIVVVTAPETVATEHKKTTTRAKRVKSAPDKAAESVAVAPTSSPNPTARYGTRSRTKQLQQQEEEAV